jgi:carbon monoxide dehydrogenase subunit G
MKLEQSFEVQAPIDQVWSALIDLERVAPCLPGASITGRDEDGTYHGEFQVKLGPTTAAYRGTISIEDADESAHRATLKARGTDKRGQGGASATIVNTLREDGGATHVDAVTDFTITGRLAAFGRGGMIKDISNRLMRDFATCLQSRLGEPAAPVAEAAAPQPDATAGEAAATLHPGGGPRATGAPAEAPAGISAAPPPPPAPPAKPVNALSLFWGALVDRIKRLFGRG